MALQRKKVCQVCNKEFTASRVDAKYCSDCRPKAKSTKQQDKRLTVAKKRIEKLPTSEEWLWVAREVRRAGTVEVLRDVDLEKLFALYKYRFKCYGWNPETKQSAFHLCHIHPVSSPSAVGLLHHLNLFVGSSLPNQIHGNNHFPGAGLSIKRTELSYKWLIDDKMSDKQILEKVEKYLGKKLVEYAKDNPIRMSQRLSIAKWVYKNDPQRQYELKELERKSTHELRKIRAEIEEREMYQMDLTKKRSFIVYLDECQRLSTELPDGQHKSNLLFMVDVLKVACACMVLLEEDGFSSVLSLPWGVLYNPFTLADGKDSSSFRDFVSFQVYSALQGGPVDRQMIRNTLASYLVVPDVPLPLIPEYREHIAANLQGVRVSPSDEFCIQLRDINCSILSLGLLSRIQEAEHLAFIEQAMKVEQAETAILEHYEFCNSRYDYSTIHFEIEDDYSTIPMDQSVLFGATEFEAVDGCTF